MKKRILFVVVLLTLIVAACGVDPEELEETVEDSPPETMENVEESQPQNGGDPEAEEANKEVKEAEEGVAVDLHITSGEQVATAHLLEEEDGVTIKLVGTNLSPGEHGFHIHEKGVCEPPDFESAGGHFNPTGAEHGLQNPKGPHAGDLENITVLEDGTV